jgi:hypothetical protein
MLSRPHHSPLSSANRPYSLSTALLLILSGFTLFIACDDPPPNDSPSVIGAEVSALCERKEGALALAEISFVIEDLQGSDTLIDPYVEYRNTSIPMEATSLPAPTSEELAMARESGEELNACGAESCRMYYSWIYDRNDEEGGLISCAEDGYPVSVIIKDINNNEKSFQIIVEREE